MSVHFPPAYFKNPQHKITVDLVGLGGTGSQMIGALARINQALIALDHPGLHVKSWDPDVVTDANLGRQLFCSSDLNLNKAVVITTRVNRFFGTEWESVPYKYNSKFQSNMIITCVDSAKTRVQIASKLNGKLDEAGWNRPYNKPYYWMDLGNLQYTGQVVLGTVRSIPQPRDQQGKSVLKHVVRKFPQIRKIDDKKQGPSCSLAEALEKQDLFINSTLAQFGAGLIWKLFREPFLTSHGCYLNLDMISVNPIKIS